jgi:type IV pilus assembly protein PilW
MVSITLGLLVIGAVLYVYLGSKGAYRTNKSTSRVQEAGRFGLDAVLRDIRQAGFIGCGSRMSLADFQSQGIYQLATPKLNVMAPGQSVVGYPAASWVEPTNITVHLYPNTDDVLEMQVGYGGSVQMVKDPDLTVPALYLANNCGAKVKMDNYVLVSSCTVATLVRVSNKPLATAAQCPASGVVAGGVEVDYAASDASNNAVNAYPANGSTALSPVAQSSPTLTSLPNVQSFDDVIYYVGQVASKARPPALYRYSATAAASAPAGAGGSEEIIDHVENMCALYGVSNAGAVIYENAATISGANAWASVVSVRVSLLAVGDETGVVDAPQPAVPWCGGALAIAATDTRFHQVFTSTAALRDHLQ